MILAKLGTAIVVPFGPVLAADGTVSTGALAYTDFRIWKNGTPGALNSSATATHDNQGVYTLSLTTADISAVGECTVALNKATLAAPNKEIEVLPAQVYDSLVGGTDLIQVDSTQQAGTALTARDIGLSVLVGDKTGFSLATPPPDVAAILAGVSLNGAKLAQPVAPDNTSITSILSIADHLATAIELDGAVYRLTANALEQAPSATVEGALDWTTSEKRQIRQALGVAGLLTATSGAGTLDTALSRLDHLIGAPTITDSTVTDPDQAIEIYRGDTAPIVFYLGIDLAGASLAFTAKANLSDSQAAALITKTSAVGGGITVTTPGEGRFSIALDAADTADLCASGRDRRIFFDVQSTLAGVIATIAAGTLTVRPDVTTPD